jgi:dsRNA-specific ribonuclease
LLKIQDNVAYKFYKYPYPTYKIVGAETNFEKKEFCIEVMDPNGLVIGKGLGKTKKDAEQDASRDALEKIAQRTVQNPS